MAVAVATVTVTGPVVALLGTYAGMQLLLQPLAAQPLTAQFAVQTWAAAPLNRTTLAPCNDPKADPLIPTRLPVVPEIELRLVMDGPAVTVKDAVALCPATVTLTVDAPAAMLGTNAVIPLGLQLVIVAVVPLKVTVLLPCGEPKPPPVITTEVPAGPLVGFSGEAMLGGTVKLMPLLETPFALTTTDPEDAPVGTVVMICPLLQFPLWTVATVPLNATVPVEPKLLPLMVT